MNTITISLIWNTISISDPLIYIGTILIGFELVRKINRFELILILIAAWPLSPIVNAFPTSEQQRARFKWKKLIKSFSVLKLLYAILFLLLLSPVSIFSFLVYILTELINAIDKLLSILWRRLIKKYEKASRKFAALIIQREKRYRGLSAAAVVRTMQNEQIPFLGTIGILLVIIGVLLKYLYGL
jgi:hypothetical protein